MIPVIRQTLSMLLADKRGSTAVEYGLIGGLMVVAIVAGLTNFAAANDANYDKIETEIGKAM